MNEKIRFVILGSGNISNTYINAVNNIDNAEISAVVSRTKSPESFPNNIQVYRKLVDVPSADYDAVIVSTPNGLHHVGTIEAANLGKHVLCEKPIDIDLDNIDKMISTCSENNVKLGVAYQRRFSSDNPIVKDLLVRKTLGNVFSVDLSIKNYRDDNYYNSAEYRGTYGLDGGGPFIQQASHYIDLYYWYFGRPQKLVSALNTFVHDIEVEDHGAVICTHSNGLISTITASTATKPGFPAKMEIYSDLGYLILENDIITHWEIEGIDNPSRSSHSNTHSGSASAVVEDTLNHELVIKDFIEAVLKDRDPLITGSQAKAATEIILEVYSKQI